jgi:hypothetical protein
MRPRGDFDVTVLTAKPFEGADSVTDWGVGLGFSGGVGWGWIPLTLGVDVMPVFWGSHQMSADLTVGNVSFPAQVTRTDQSVFFDAWLRLEPPTWMIRPYLEGVVGMKFLQTKYSVDWDTSRGQGSLETTTENNTASSIGWGAGIAYRAIDMEAQHRPSLFVTLGVRSMRGGTASYSRVVHTADGDGVVDYRTPTDTILVMLSIGAKFEFGPTPSPPEQQPEAH